MDTLRNRPTTIEQVENLCGFYHMVSFHYSGIGYCHHSLIPHLNRADDIIHLCIHTLLYTYDPRGTHRVQPRRLFEGGSSEGQEGPHGTKELTTVTITPSRYVMQNKVDMRVSFAQRNGSQPFPMSWTLLKRLESLSGLHQRGSDWTPLIGPWVIFPLITVHIKVHITFTTV